MRTNAPPLAPVFRSDGQARLLTALLVATDDDEFSLTDLADRAGVAYPSAHREVTRLLEAGILTERRVGRSRLVRANDASALVPPLRQIVTIVGGPAVLLTDELGRIRGVDAAFLYGSFAARMSGLDGPSPGDVDVMVVGSPETEKVYAACDRVEAAVHRPVNATILTAAELDGDSGFLRSIRENAMVPLVGDIPWR